MKLNSLLEYLLEEPVKQKTVKPEIPEEAPEGSPMGKYLFAPERTDTPTPKEKNTAEESKALDSLSMFYHRGSVNQETDDGLKKLLYLSKQGLYSKLLNPPVGLAYRFIGDVTPAESSKFLGGLPTETIISEPNKAFYTSDVGIVNNPAIHSTVSRKTTKLSSWTIKPTSYAMKNFVQTGMGHVALVLVADIKSNSFFMNPKNISKSLDKNDSSNFSIETIKSEQEVIGYGPIGVLGVAWMFVGSELLSTDKLDQIITRTPDVRPPPGILKGEFVSPKYFLNSLKYIENLLAVYKSFLPRGELKDILSSKEYTGLKAAAQNGMSFGPDFLKVSLGGAYIARWLNEAISSRLTHTVSVDQIQKALLKAVNLKTEKQS